MSDQPDQIHDPNREQKRGAFAAWLPGSFLFMGVIWGSFWGCGTDQPLEPTAMSSSNQSDSVRQPYHSGGGASSGTTAAEAVDPDTERQAVAFLQQVQGADPAVLHDILFDGLSSPDPNIQLMALNGLEPMLSWNAQARSDLQNMLQYESDPGMRRRINDLLAKEVAPVLQPTDAGAAQN